MAMEGLKELDKLKTELGIFDKEYCTEEEEKEIEALEMASRPLPSNIACEPRQYKHFKRVPMDLDEKALNELYALKQIKRLNSIDKSLKFFVILTIVSLSISVLAGIIIGLGI